MNDDPREAAKVIMAFMESLESHVTPSDLDRQVSRTTGFDPKVIRRAVKSLVREGLLEYRDKNGRTVISLSFSRPVRLSNHVIVSPPDICVDEKPGDVVIRLNSGTAFGRGDHPTTQLCVIALDSLLTGEKGKNHLYRTALDIGTGSGILALAAAKLGVQKIRACDRDHVAESEARDNITLNGLHERILMVPDFDTELTYDMIIANLRYPTLIDLYPVIEKITHEKSVLVLSGIKDGEVETVQGVYAGTGRFECLWTGSRQGWSGLIYKRPKSTILS